MKSGLSVLSLVRVEAETRTITAPYSYHESKLSRHNLTQVMPSHYSVNTHTFNPRYLIHAAFLSPMLPVPSQYSQHHISPFSGQSSPHASLTNAGSPQKHEKRHPPCRNLGIQVSLVQSTSSSIQLTSQFPILIYPSSCPSYFVFALLCNHEP